MHPLKPLLLASASLILAALAQAGAIEPLNYRLSGEGLSGTLGGVAFTDATWSIAASGDPGLLESHSFNMGAEIPFHVIPVNGAPVMTIADEVNSWSVNLQDVGALEWFVVEVDYSGVFGADATGYGFAVFDPSLFEEGSSGSYGFVALVNAGFGNLVTGESIDLTGGSSGGAPEDFAFVTSGGDLVAMVGEGPAGRFTASSIPEPSAFTGLAGLGALACASCSRRRRG